MLSALNIRNLVLHLPALLLALTGLSVAWAGSNYRTGSLTAMGPGFMPMALGVCLFLLALTLLWSEREGKVRLATLPLRPVLYVAAGILIWALMVDVAGFFPAAAAQLLLSAGALPQKNWRRVVIGAALLSLATWVLFVIVLRLPLAAFGS